mmetsp:Transcript_31211/g.41301  ORF Transcript_31211/g.41301 Transcript_31211/m.41301 type:complete len:249 (-) Transcript_31211:447-1193(-)|eukprot:CAMPEP_0117751876 /NCGR_PEP_ID=MMETSP0947-20121206/11250_1 /TAXON_ID=44440 /ORGANISM="Chattonella subsalsa, Strain CCMP2191" /LENGTH=248 /DNA_ID=CAMNT_0005570369 /DNA_START=136 /DNA_END=882 /DNA_ORIENTATION=+
MSSFWLKEVIQGTLFLLAIWQSKGFGLSPSFGGKARLMKSDAIAPQNILSCETVLYSTIQEQTESNASSINSLQEDISIGDLPVQTPTLSEAAPTQQEELAASEEDELENVPYFYARDFVNTTWVVATMWDAKGQVDTTKVFLRDDGTCIWLNGAEGTWRLNTRRRAISIYRDFKFGWGGKRIFSTALDQPYSGVYLNGTIKGWAPWSPAKIWGVWQAVKQGTDFEKWGMPPWYEENPGTDSVTAPLE